MTQITSARIHYNDQGMPVSEAFDDVYFSDESGLHETQYVFIDKNRLAERWPLHANEHFHIIETGFGTGLNFLVAWRNFQRYLQQQPHSRCQRLYFSTFEKFPLTATDLTQALACWPELADLAQLLLGQYPKAIQGCHRLCFQQGQVVLDLWLGDVHDNLPQLPESNQADAWFLDGFAPSKNPEMWQDSLFHGMARLSKVGTTVATFTCAGVVRRGLQSAGFQVQKVKGYGRKREMAIAEIPATGVHAGKISSAPPQEISLTSEQITASQTTLPVVIVGGGIAAMLVALALVQRGRAVHLLCADAEVGVGASHNRQGALYPQLQSSFTLNSRFHLACFGFAHRRYQQLLQNFSFPADFCGVLQLACNEQLVRKFSKISTEPAYAETVVQPVSAEQACQIAGVELPFTGLFFADGGWIAPQLFCQAAYNWLQQQPGFQASFHCKLEHFTATASGFLLTSSPSATGTALIKPPPAKAEQLVLCTGQNLHRLAQTCHLPLNLIRGQVSHVRSASLSKLNTVICHQGYVTPQSPAFSAESCIGATFDREVDQHQPIAAVTAVDDQFNIDLVNTVLQQPSWFADAEVSSAKAAFRTTAPDHLPIAGALIENCYLLGGLGARGLLFAPLLAETLAARICGEPEPLSTSLSAMVCPSRFASLS